MTELKDLVVIDEGGRVVGVQPDLSLSEARQPREFVKKKKIKKPLKPEEIKFVENMAKGMTQKEAIMDSHGVTNSQSAVTMSSRLVKKKEIQELVADVLKRHSVDLEEALKPIIRGLKAKRVIQYKDDAFVSDIDDISTQIQASDRVLKLMGAYQKKSEDGVGNNYIQVNNYHKDKYNEDE